MVIEDLQTIIKSNIDDDAADVNEAIDMAIKYLSNFFGVRKIDSAQTVATNDTYIEKPDRCLEVLNVSIDTDGYLDEAKVTDFKDIMNADVRRWYIEDEYISGTDNKIHFTKAIDLADNGKTVYVQYLAGFTPLGGVALSNTDLPERLEPLMISLATYFYYGILVSYVKNNKSSFENMTLWDVISVWDTWRIHSMDLLDSIKNRKAKIA